MKIFLSAFFLLGGGTQIVLYLTGYAFPWLPSSACICFGLAFAYLEMEVLERAIIENESNRLVMRYRLTGKTPDQPE